MNWSGVVAITLFAILMIWDGVCVFFLGGVQSSVSQAIVNWFGFNPVPFYAGCIVGHLTLNLWPDTTRLKNAWERFNNGWTVINPILPSYEELDAAIKELVNRDNGPLRYFKKGKT